jgi:copper transport protein
MQRLAWTSSGGQAALLRMGGALLLAAGFSRRAGFARARAGDTALALARVLALAGGMLVIVSPAVTGHTSVHALRWLLAPLLMVHSGIVAFWLGALAPLLLAVTREPPAVAARLLQRFSAVATWLVPVIALAGLAMALILCPGLGVLGQPYGRLLAGKLAAFLVLVVLAALNRWRYTPRLAAGQSAATTALRRTIATEYLLIALVLALTAMLTGWYGPEG